MKKLYLKESCTQYSVARNRYGDLKLTTVATILCLYRDINQLTRGVNYREEMNVIGIFWFDPTAAVKMGDVIGYNGQLYRVENVVNAKQLVTTNLPHFIKCNVSLYRSIS